MGSKAALARILALIFVFIASPGCTALNAAGEMALSPSSGSTTADPVVIAIIDSGTNPYLPVFYQNDPEEFVIPGSHEIQLSDTGTLEERLEADAGFWSNVEVGSLYRIDDSRLFIVTFDPAARIPTFDSSAHGAYVTHLAAASAPHAVIVSVQVDISLETTSPTRFHASVATAMEWIADQEWIDVISVSLGIPPNFPDNEAGNAEMARWLQASERAASSGKLIVAASGNHVSPPLGHYTNGPPWVIAVGGVEHHAKGEAILSGRGVDVVANYSNEVPTSGNWDETRWVSGTSFAVPIVAGTLASAWDLVRKTPAGDEADPLALREALNASAVYFAASEWTPVPPSRGDPLRDSIGYLSLPVAAQAQMGWGFVEPTLSSEIARRVIEGDTKIASGKEQAQAFQGAWQGAREEYWT